MIFKLYFLLLLPFSLLTHLLSIPQLIKINDENVRLSENCDLSLLENINSFSFNNGNISFNTTPIPTFESIFFNVFNFYNKELPKTSYLDMKPVLKKLSSLSPTLLNENMGTWQTALMTVNGFLKRCDQQINKELNFFWKLWKLEEIVAKPKKTEFANFSFEYRLNSTLQQKPNQQFINKLKLFMSNYDFLLPIVLLPSSEKSLEFDGVFDSETPIGPQGYAVILNNLGKNLKLYFVQFSIKMKLKGTLFLYITDDKGKIKKNFQWNKIDTNGRFEVLNFELNDTKFALDNGCSFLVDYEGKGAFMLREGEDELNDNIILQKKYVKRNDVKNWKKSGNDIVDSKESVAMNLTMKIIST